MKIVLSNHAKERMTQRGVKINEVRECVDMPDYVIARGHNHEAYKKIRDKTLKVVYAKEDNFIKIITLIWK